MKRSTKLLAAAGIIVLGVAAIAGTTIASGRHGQGGQYMGMSSGMHGKSMGSGMHGMGQHMNMSSGMHGMRMMDRFDANDDGKITADEIAAVRDKAIADHDADKDGMLSLDEFQGVWLDHMRTRMVRHFQHMDVNGDGKVTTDEINTPMKYMMQRMDRNEDGAISKDDMRGHGRYMQKDDDQRRGPMYKHK
jgi:Ca2+-binding EF-hand superfamily protein